MTTDSTETSPPAIPDSSESTATDSCCEIKGLSHSYKSHHAVKSVSFSIGRKSIHGFVGPNGAGKTTTLKVLATLVKPQSGSVTMFGHDVAKDFKKVRRRVGYMQDHFSMYRQMTVFEYLDFFGAAYGISSAKRTRTIADILALTDMSGRSDDLIRGLSRGMQQRVSLARSLVHDPDLLLLDEPASGLDPRARIELMEILQELCSLGKTVFISSHILSELATLCDSVTILDRGEVRYTGSMRGLMRRDESTGGFLIELGHPHPEATEALLKLDGVVNVVSGERESSLRVTVDSARVGPNALLQAVMQSGAEVAAFSEDLKQLNQAFMDLTEPGVRS
ncbi:MAG: ABC-2 type transport system ATP-binding protein [Verrucomicrobiales bacterium]|jgi:ABC-2 type transport system ATP-binding protein